MKVRRFVYCREMRRIWKKRSRSEFFIKNESHLITADVGDAASLDVALDEVISLLGWPDIIICNSGGLPIGTFEQHDEDVWYQAFEQQLMMIIRCVKKFSGHMVQSKWGRFINISSTVALSQVLL